MPTYLSKEKLEELKEELETRQKKTRREIAEKIADAKELGDLSENFEYHQAKDEQGMNEARIAGLKEMIKDAVLVESREGLDSIQLGATFTVKQEGGKERTFELVGSTESDPLSGKISNDSPLGKAFIGHKEGDTIEVETPAGTTAYEVLQIK